MKQLKRLGLLLLPLTLLLVFMLITDPYHLPLVWLILPFMLFSVGVYQLAYFLMSKTPLSLSKIRVIAGMTTGLLVLLIILQSIQQLSFKDFLILTSLLGGLTFYLRRIDL